MSAPQPSVLLGYAPIDSMHAEFDEVVALTLAAGDAELHACLERLQAHLVAHFGQEETWMRSTDFPSTGCHVDEHARVLASAAEVLPLVAAGRFDIGRDFTRELERWFPGHADYLDSALAAWLCKKQYGGKPVALHLHKRFSG